jgi:hypothetical protein
MDINYSASLNEATVPLTRKQNGNSLFNRIFGFPKYLLMGTGSIIASKTFRNILLYAVYTGVLVYATAYYVNRSSSKTVSAVSPDVRVNLANPVATQVLNKNYSFPITDAAGKEITKLKYTIGSAELRNEIIVSGKPAVAIQGKTFLILSIKITNSFDKSLNVNARDYIRLTTNGNDSEFMAADIHNDPVNIQPISTKDTRIGFTINDTDKNLKLLVGQIKDPKETVLLSLK